MDEDGTNWSTVDAFPNVFRYTQLLEIDWTNRVEMCNPFLYLKSGNSSVCKLQSRLGFDDLSCAELVNTLFTEFGLPNSVFAKQLSKLASGLVFTVVQINESNINFDPIDDPTFFCKVTIDRDFHSALENIYSATSITLHDFKTLLASYFPEPVCQTLKFNIPTASQKYTKLYSLYPRLLAKFLAQHLKVKYTCLILENNATSDPLPVVFKSRLDLFHRLFSSLPKPGSARVET